jgi:hypothetical protein
LPRKVKLSGAQEKKLRAAREAGQQSQVRAAAVAAGVPLAGDEEVERCAVEFDELLERFDPGSPGFFAAAQELGARQMLRSRRVPPEEKWKLLDRMASTHGLQQNRNELEELAGRLEDMLLAARPKTAVNVQDKPDGYTRPATSRGGSRARGPQPLPGHPARPDEPNR